MGFFDAGYARDCPPVRLIEADPELFEGLDARAANEARMRVVASTERLEAGSWSGACSRLEAPASALGLLVLDGLLLRSLEVNGPPRSEILGPGDVLRPWEPEGDVGSVPFRATWQVLEPTRLAVLDARVLAALCSWPCVVSAIMSRMLHRSRFLALQLAICDLRRVDERLLLLLWHFADRWGRVRPDGVHVPVRTSRA